MARTPPPPTRFGPPAGGQKKPSAARRASSPPPPTKFPAPPVRQGTAQAFGARLRLAAPAPPAVRRVIQRMEEQRPHWDEFLESRDDLGTLNETDRMMMYSIFIARNHHPLQEVAKALPQEKIDDVRELLRLFIAGARAKNVKYDTGMINCVNIRDTFKGVLAEHGIDSVVHSCATRAMYFCPYLFDPTYAACSVYDAGGKIFGTWKAFDNHHALKLGDGRICDPTGGFVGDENKWIIKLNDVAQVPTRETYIFSSKPKVPPKVKCYALQQPCVLRGIDGAFEMVTKKGIKITCLLETLTVEAVLAAWPVLNDL